MSNETRTTNCPACDGLVSRAADACPHCGHPMDAPARSGAARAGERAGPAHAGERAGPAHAGERAGPAHAGERERAAAPDPGSPAAAPRDRVWRVAHRGLLGRWALVVLLGAGALVLAGSTLVGGDAPPEPAAPAAPADPADAEAPAPEDPELDGDTWRLLGAAALGLGALLALASIGLVRLGTRYVLTADGWVRERRGIVAKRTAELHVSDIRLVNVRQSVPQRLLGVGDLDVSSAGLEGVEITFAGLRDPEDAKRAILDAEALDRRRTGHPDGD